MRRRHRKDRDVLGFAAFGAGMLVCVIFPTNFLILVLAAALILCGLSCGKH